MPYTNISLLLGAFEIVGECDRLSPGDSFWSVSLLGPGHPQEDGRGEAAAPCGLAPSRGPPRTWPFATG